MVGSTTDSVNAAATAASTALPPSPRTRAPAREACGLSVTTMARGERTTVPSSMVCAAAERDGESRSGASVQRYASVRFISISTLADDVS